MYIENLNPKMMKFKYSFAESDFNGLKKCRKTNDRVNEKKEEKLGEKQVGSCIVKRLSSISFHTTCRRQHQ